MKSLEVTSFHRETSICLLISVIEHDPRNVSYGTLVFLVVE